MSEKKLLTIIIAVIVSLTIVGTGVGFYFQQYQKIQTLEKEKANLEQDKKNLEKDKEDLQKEIEDLKGTEDEVTKTYNIGDKITLKDENTNNEYTFSVDKAYYYSSEQSQPGTAILMFDLICENNSSGKIDFDGTDFKLSTEDDVQCKWTFIELPTGMSYLSTIEVLYSGQKMKGVTTFEVPSDQNKFKFIYKNNIINIEI